MAAVAGAAAVAVAVGMYLLLVAKAPPAPPNAAAPAAVAARQAAPATTSAAAGNETADAGVVAGAEGGVKPPPEPSEDPVAEAQVVLENYLAADLGHDGQEMKKYLGGQAAARFRADVQGQEDVTIHSKKVSSHTVQDDNTISFKVAVEWSAEDSKEVKSDTEDYTVKRTEKGWLITSTPAYPAE